MSVIKSTANSLMGRNQRRLDMSKEAELWSAEEKGWILIDSITLRTTDCFKWKYTDVAMNDAEETITDVNLAEPSFDESVNTLEGLQK